MYDDLRISGTRGRQSVVPAALPATAALFCVNGALLASWVAEVPVVRSELGLSDARLGVALAGVTLGSVLILPLTTWLLRRLRPGGVTFLSGAVMAAGLALTGFASSWPLLVTSLIAFGAGFGLMDVALNVVGVRLEAQLHRSLLSRLHGMYSLGALLGVLLGALLITRGWDRPQHLTALSVLGLIAAAGCSRGLSAVTDYDAGDASPTPPGRGGLTVPLALLGLLAFAAAVAEGAVGDWAGVYLRETVGSPPGAAALAFAGFSLTMLLGRLAGDGLATRFGPAPVGAAGVMIALAGLGLAVGVPVLAASTAGFMLFGLGLSVLAPLTFSAAGHWSAGNPAAMAVVGGVFYAGFVAGPPLLGVAAQASALRLAWLVVGALLGVALVLTPWLSRRTNERPMEAAA